MSFIRLSLTMSISSFFSSLGAPLANSRWSWFSQRPSDGAVFLRVWQDLKFISDDQTFILVAGSGVKDMQQSGGRERIRHLASIRAGAPCYLVMCMAKDVDAISRTIQGFNESEVFASGEVLDTKEGFPFPPRTSQRAQALTKLGGTWIRLGRRTPIADVVA